MVLALHLGDDLGRRTELVEPADNLADGRRYEVDIAGLLRVPVDALAAPYQNPIQYFVQCIREGRPVEGPLAPKIARIGQQIVDSAVLSARLRKTVKLID